MDAFVISVIASLIAAAILAIWTSRRPLTAALGRQISRFTTEIHFQSKWDLADVYSKLATAQKRVFILQTWFPEWRAEHAAWEALMTNLQDRDSSEEDLFEMKVLLLDPSLYHARLRARGDLKEIHVGGISMFSRGRQAELRHFIQSYRSERISIEVALYNSLPFGPIYIIDDLVYWGLFVSDRDSMGSACFRAPAQSESGRIVSSSFKNAWQTRSSILKPSASIAERKQAELEICNKFNSLRKQLSSFRLLGRLRVDPTDTPAPDASDLDCIQQCLDSAIKTLVIMRHAATSLNEAGIFSGLLPVNLSDNGKRQIEDLFHLLPKLRDTSWTKTYCSTVTRTKETLELLLQNPSEVIPRRELDERNIGQLEGELKSQIETARDDRRNCWKFFWEPTLGESYARLLDRIHQSVFLEELTGDLLGDSNILVCTHEGPLKIFRMLFESTRDVKPEDLDAIEFVEIRNCDVYVYVNYDDIDQSSKVHDCVERAESLRPSQVL